MRRAVRKADTVADPRWLSPVFGIPGHSSRVPRAAGGYALPASMSPEKCPILLGRGSAQEKLLGEGDLELSFEG